MLFGRKSWSRSLPSLGAHTASSAASAARATPRPSTPSPAFLSHCLRSKLIDPPSLSFIDPPSYPPPRRGEGTLLHIRPRAFVPPRLSSPTSGEGTPSHA